MNDGNTTTTARGTIGDALSLRHNSLNFLRLALALAVILSHCVAFGPYPAWFRWESYNSTPLGTLAVYGFFAISGYLIAGSALSHGAARYLWQRFLRIFPAFWVCLVMTAFVFGVIAWFAVPQACPHFSCYLHNPNGPLQYLYHNALLRGKQVSISGTPHGDYDPLVWGIWNGSTWTLFYEFLCYLILLGLAVLGILRQRLVVLCLTAALVVTITVISLDGALRSHFTHAHNWMPMNLMRFSAIFLTGALIYLYRDRLPDSGWLALACAGVFVIDLVVPVHHLLAESTFAPSVIAAPLIGYPLLWLGAHLPLQRVGAHNDYSYGMYIYAFPVSQLLAIWGATRLGYLPYTALVVVATACLAVASWWLVEKRALQLKAVSVWPRERGSSAVTTTPLDLIPPERVEEGSFVIDTEGPAHRHPGTGQLPWGLPRRRSPRSADPVPGQGSDEG